MSTISQRSFIQSQILETNHLLKMTGDHPLMTPVLKQRKEDLEKELNSLPAGIKQPRTILFFTGKPVLGSRGIDAEFAAKVMEPFIEMVKTQYVASKHGSVGSRGPRRDESEARLLLTGLPRGSFGLELSQPDPLDLFASEHLSSVLVQLTKVIASAGENDEGFAFALGEVTTRVLQRLGEFFKTISDFQADLRMVSGELECQLNHLKVTQAYERVSGVTTDQKSTEKVGVFRGATLDSWRFDFHCDDGETISGKISEDVSESEVEHMIPMTNKPSKARLHEIIVTTRSGITKSRYELLGLDVKSSKSQKSS